MKTMEPGCKQNRLDLTFNIRDLLILGNKLLKLDSIHTFEIFQQIQIQSMDLGLKILKLAY